MKRIFAALLFSLLNTHVQANDDINNVLAMESAPHGVVFEIVSGRSDKLDQLIPQVQVYIKQLREKFTDLPIAVVSHGREQFALTTENSKQHLQVHNTVKSLVQDQDVSVHVCGTYASWNNVEEEAFPDYVNVSPAGPAQINDYLNLDYIHIEL